MMPRPTVRGEAVEGDRTLEEEWFFLAAAGPTAWWTLSFAGDLASDEMEPPWTDVPGDEDRAVRP